jgi:hypothetical protein
MKLHRISKNIFSDHEESLADFWSHDGETRLDFRKFGAGENKGFFRATFEWADVEALIQVFASDNHAEAIRLQRARILGAAVEAVVKISN